MSRARKAPRPRSRRKRLGSSAAARARAISSHAEACRAHHRDTGGAGTDEEEGWVGDRLSVTPQRHPMFHRLPLGEIEPLHVDRPTYLAFQPWHLSPFRRLSGTHLKSALRANRPLVTCKRARRSALTVAAERGTCVDVGSSSLLRNPQPHSNLNPKSPPVSLSSDRRVANTTSSLLSGEGNGRRSNISEFIVTMYCPWTSLAVVSPSLKA